VIRQPLIAPFLALPDDRQRPLSRRLVHALQSLRAPSQTLAQRAVAAPRQASGGGVVSDQRLHDWIAAMSGVEPCASFTVRSMALFAVFFLQLFAGCTTRHITYLWADRTATFRTYVLAIKKPAIPIAGLLARHFT